MSDIHSKSRSADSDLFPCEYRGTPGEHWDCGCAGLQQIHACSHPENIHGDCLRFKPIQQCGKPAWTHWTCSNCLLTGRVSGNGNSYEGSAASAPNNISIVTQGNSKLPPKMDFSQFQNRKSPFRIALEEGRKGMLASIRESQPALPRAGLMVNLREEPLRFISLRQMGRDVLDLVGKMPANISMVCGIPRSGMIPASMLSTLLNLPLGEVSRTGEIRTLDRGVRMDVYGGRVTEGIPLIVDDTIYNGYQIQQLRRQIQQPVMYAVVYARPESFSLVDFYAKELPSPHLLEWNLFNGGIWNGNASNAILAGGFATDLDGILCFDCPLPDADGGPGLDAYENWMRNARPKWLTRSVTTKLIVTARLEKYRPITEQWLKKWGVRWDKLIMHPASAASQRGDVASWKSQIISESTCGLYVESDPNLARQIAERCRKPVVCPDSEQVFVF